MVGRSEGYRLHGVLVAMLVAGPVVATEIYKSVDAQGRVTYSQKPPASAVSLEKMDIAPLPDDPDAAARAARELDALREHNDRMQARREASVRARAETRPPLAAPQVIVQQVPLEDSADDEPWLVPYPVPYHRPHHRPPYHRPSPPPPDPGRIRTNDLHLLEPDKW